MEFEFELRKEICRRYAGGTERNIGAGSSGAENRGRHGTQLESADCFTEVAGGNISANFRSDDVAGNRYGCAGDATESVLHAGDPVCGYGSDHARVRSANHGFGTGGEGNDHRCNPGGTEADPTNDNFDRSTLWATEREIFESNLRRAAEPAKVDAPVSAHQPHSQRTATHPAVDAAYLTANLLSIFDDDDEVEDCTTRYYGPTLSM